MNLRLKLLLGPVAVLAMFVGVVTMASVFKSRASQEPSSAAATGAQPAPATEQAPLKADTPAAAQPKSD
jgi:hypothetical protein